MYIRCMKIIDNFFGCTMTEYLKKILWNIADDELLALRTFDWLLVYNISQFAGWFIRLPIGHIF